MDELLSSALINPDLLGPTLPAIPPFTLPTGPTGFTGPPSDTGPTGPGCIEPLPTFTQIVYVNKAGNDATADGSECAPFLTVTAAMASITDAIAPFPDPLNIMLSLLDLATISNH